MTKKGRSVANWTRQRWLLCTLVAVAPLYGAAPRVLAECPQALRLVARAATWFPDGPTHCGLAVPIRVTAP